MIKAIVLHEGGWNIVNADHEHGFGSVCRQEDRGDPWEYYGPLRATTTTTLPLVDPVPPAGQAAFSYQYGGQGSAFGGPVMAEMTVRSPFGEGNFGVRIRLYAGLPRVEIETELTNQQSCVRYRNVFPFNLSRPTITYEIPFGAIERPEGEYPAQNWVDLSDGEHGVALLNRGIPGHSLVGNVLTSSLMKCTRVVSYHGGGYSSEARDTAGLEIGITHRCEQALLPHRGTWREARLWQEGEAFNVPLGVRKVSPHAGPLPSTGSFMSIEPATLTLHALYVEDGQLVLRLAETVGRGVDAQVTLQWPISAAHETDLIGRLLRSVSTDRTSFRFSAAPFEIKTFRIDLA
jgi:alpha-mannosidase